MKQFLELREEEAMMIEGGDTYKRDRIEYLKENNLIQGTEESEKAAICYTLGYLSLATCWCGPVSFAFGLAGTLYGCN